MIFSFTIATKHYRIFLSVLKFSVEKIDLHLNITNDYKAMCADCNWIKENYK